MTWWDNLGLDPQPYRQNPDPVYWPFEIQRYVDSGWIYFNAYRDCENACVAAKKVSQQYPDAFTFCRVIDRKQNIVLTGWHRGTLKVHNAPYFPTDDLYPQ